MYDALIRRLQDFAAGTARDEDAQLAFEATDAIEQLTAYVALYKDGGETAMKVANDYKARIEELQAQLMYSNDAAKVIAEKVPKWIPVAERLPEENGRYLALYPLKTKPSVWWHKVYGFAKDLVEVDKYEFNEHKPGFYGYHDEYGYYEDKNVTHWMPLPEPPEDSE